MKKTLTTIFLVIMILTVAGVALLPEQTNAWCASATGCIQDIGANLSQTVLTVVSWFLSICGILLNVAIVLTLNIKTLYEATPAIGEVWVIIRNISSIFIIFGLLYTSIQTILDIGSPSVTRLIKNIIIAGLLINFSLFFAKVLIDGSNLVSMQFYRAIVPNSAAMGTDMSSIITSSFKSGGISDIFMSGLKIPKIYDQKGGILQSLNVSMLIIIHTLLGSILMIIAGLTLIAAALAFIVRIALLLFFMAFSPLYFIGIIFPKVESEIKKYVDIFIGQLIFMPVYLILLYVALRFIGDGNFFTSLNNQTTASSDGDMSKLILGDTGLIFQYIFALIMINIPLMAAFKTGAIAPKWTKDIQGMAGKWVGNLGQHTIGRAAKRAGDAVATSRWASKNPNLALLADKSLSKVASSTFAGTKGGYKKRFDNFAKERSDFVNKRYSLATDKIEDIEEKTNSGVKLELANKVANADKVIANSQIKVDSNTAAAALAEERFNNHNKNIEQLEREYKETSEVFGPETPAAKKIKEKIANEKASIAIEKTTLDKTRLEAANAAAENKKAKEDKEKYGKVVAAIEKRDKTGEKIKDGEINKIIDEHEEPIKKNLREEEMKKITEQFAKDLDNDRNPITRRASKEAANQIRKNKSKPKFQRDLESAFKQIADSEKKESDDKGEDDKKDDKKK